MIIYYLKILKPHQVEPLSDNFRELDYRQDGLRVHHKEWIHK